MTEFSRIEYKQTLTESLGREVIAFLNSGTGGVIYLGINDQGNVIGLDNSDVIQLKIKEPVDYLGSPFYQRGAGGALAFQQPNRALHTF